MYKDNPTQISILDISSIHILVYPVCLGRGYLSEKDKVLILTAPLLMVRDRK